MKYEEFLASKRIADKPTGFEPGELNAKLFPFQAAIVKWALKRGRAAIWADCGLGKTPMQLEWARHVARKTNQPVLILAPLAVAQQTVREGRKFGIEVVYSRKPEAIENRDNIWITNYQMLEHFDPSIFGGIVLDESSILKSQDGSTRTAIIEAFANTPYRLACTATPAPNDHMELANHAEFLGVMRRVEMLATFFIHDGGDTSIWRLKGHAEKEFWRWMASWAVIVRKPSDIGFSDEGYILPPLKMHRHILPSKNLPGYLIPTAATTLEDQRTAKRDTISDRVKKAVALAKTDGYCIVCGELNVECDMAEDLIPNAKQVSGSQDLEVKEAILEEFAKGKLEKIVSKASIIGFGLNLQHCHEIVVMNLSHSYEALYQLIRRCWRFGQKKTVNVHLILSESEYPILDNIQRKQKEADSMAENMVAAMGDEMKKNIGQKTARKQDTYQEQCARGKDWAVHLGDSCEKIKELEMGSIHYSIFSPPFASLYTYSASERDMGNCTNDATFMQHFKFLINELLRVTMPGRLLSFHCMNLPTSKQNHGVIGIRDFRGELIRSFVEAGWIYHSEVCIWKDPVTAMQRTKALGLLHKQIKKDSCMSRQGIADYLVTMRKPGDNPERVTHTNESFPVSLWQRYASPVWMDICATNTLDSIREDDDEKHICPLQLEVIERAIDLWTNPGDLVFSPFTGIGSEGYVSLLKMRRFVGIELKKAYWETAIKNLNRACVKREEEQTTLFDEKPVAIQA